MKLAIRTERGYWTNARLQRTAYLRRRYYAVVVVCMLLCGCAVWPSPQYGLVQMVRGDGEWFVFFQVWGREYHVSTPDRDAAVLIDALLWSKGRSVEW
jgi:hypothetical protein